MFNPVINNLISNINQEITNVNLDYIKGNLIKIAFYIINETNNFSIKYIKYKEQHPYLLVPCKNIYYNLVPEKAVIINLITNEKNIITHMIIINRIKSKTDLIEMYYEIELFFNYHNEDINNKIQSLIYQ